MKIISVFTLLLLFTVSAQAQNSISFKKGMFFYEKTELDSALFYFKKDLFVNKNAPDAIKAYSLLYVAKTLKTQQNYIEALNYYKWSESILKKNQNYDQLSFLYTSLSEYYRAKKDGLLANTYLEKSKKIIDNFIVTKKNIAYFWNRKAAILLEFKNDFNEAIKCSEKVIEIAREINDNELEASSLNELACIFENFKDNRAEKYFKQSIKINEIANKPLAKVEVIANLCRWYMNNKRYDEAKKLLDQGLKIVEANNYELVAKNYYELFSVYYKEKKDFEKALYYESLQANAEFLELNRKWNRDLLVAERKYELIKNQNEIKEKSLLLKLQEKQIANYSIRSMVLLVLLLAVSVIVILVFYFLKKVKKQNQKLQLLSDENKFLMAEANHRINNNLQLIIVLINHEITKSTKKANTQVKKILAKVDAVATLHKHLYKNDDKHNVDIKKYLSDIKTNFQFSFEENNIQINFKIQSHPIKVDMAMYLGLLLTELIINSLKHAFSNQTIKEINFDLAVNKNTLHFRYSDNGSGTDKKVTLKLIDELCQQIKISYQLDTTNKFLFTFTKEI